jgi:hypothetical protein
MFPEMCDALSWQHIVTSSSLIQHVAGYGVRNLSFKFKYGINSERFVALEMCGMEK